MSYTYIIAEAGVNHNGSISMAKQLVDIAAEAGVDAVKFQTYKTENLVTKNATQAAYQQKNMNEQMSQYEMLKQYELDYDEFVQIKQYCDEKNITFLSTPFDKESVDFLIQKLKLNVIKISSGELNNAPLLSYIGNYRINIILSTGMAVIEEIHQALAFLSCGFAQKNIASFQDVMDFYQTTEAKQLIKKYVTILHCTTEYPTPPHEVNLKAINYLANEFGVSIGFSDHTSGITIPIASVAAGAKMIEKHFTLDRNLPGPDHKASLEKNELVEMVKGIRTVEKALGIPEKKPTPTELENRKVARKSLVAAEKINKGDIFTIENLTVKRPGTGISPEFFWDFLGRRAERNYDEDEIIR